LISSSISRPAGMHGLLMSIPCPGRNVRISLPTSAARPRFTAHRCGRRNRSGTIRSRRFARRPCSIRRATTASGMRCSTRCGSSNAISGMGACWRHASFAREEIPLSLTGHFCRKPGQLWPMQQRSLSRTASSACRLLFATTKCFSAMTGWKCCNGASAASAIEFSWLSAVPSPPSPWPANGE